ncbi:MAG TPA: RidA family protein [Chloroflexota bacterium]|nr:RidA family protein [Chloroflexota bacterium]
MTLKAHNPQTPLANYSHGIEVPPNARWLHISGQVAVDNDGRTPQRFEDQVQLVFDNLRAVLAKAGMSPKDLVKVNVYLLRPEDIPALRAARDAFQGDARPASTLVIVSRLVRPEWLVEIEAVAAQAA